MLCWVAFAQLFPFIVADREGTDIHHHEEAADRLCSDIESKTSPPWHLFQNRYKSILCQEDPYFLELVRYIHLNALRAKIVSTIKELDNYPYCGHHILLGKGKNDWQDTRAVLSIFGCNLSAAREQYRDFVEEGICLGKRPELIGGGLTRSAGGWQAMRSLRILG